MARAVARHLSIDALWQTFLTLHIAPIISASLCRYDDWLAGRITEDEALGQDSEADTAEPG